MGNNWTSKVFLAVLKLAALAAVVFVGLSFRSADVKKLSFELGNNVGNDFEQQLSEMKENIQNKFPDLEGIQQKKYQWNYAGKKYSVSQDLYESVYNFYKSQPKTYTYFSELPANWEDEYYGMFIVQNEKDLSISNLADAIKKIGEKNKLNEDQIAELVLAFVQSIPYDDQKAENILSKNNNETMSYPYELLYENKGVCSDKSFLATVLLRSLGYGTTLFVYENENHMAIGIQCPKEYSTYGSGYCYAETTSVGNKIGIVPQLKTGIGKAVGEEQLAYFDESQDSSDGKTTLTEVKIFQETVGKEYRGIIQTIKINKEIETLKNEINVLSGELKKLKNKIDEYEKDLADRKKELDKYLKNDEIDKYNKGIKKYNELLEEYKDEVKNYNSKVNLYNKKVARYNYLIKL